MNERYLFRGKSVIDSREWIRGGIVYDRFVNKYTIVTINSRGNLIDHGVDPATIGQYTGLHDKNGALIFEGDIVITPFGKSRVAWSADYCCWFMMGIDSNRVLIPGRDFNGYEIEIIGNIHDNPELLQGIQP